MHGQAKWRAMRAVTLLVATALPVWSTSASAQQPSSAPGALPDALPSEEPGDLSPAHLLERLRKMERTVNDLSDRNKDLELKYRQISQDLAETKRKTSDKQPVEAIPITSDDDGTPLAPSSDAEAAQSLGIDSEPMQGEGGFTREFNEQLSGNRNLGQSPVMGNYNFGRGGYEFATRDGEVSTRIRYLVQADARFFNPSNENPVTSGFYLPRARLYFDGHITKPVEYQLSFQQAYDNFNLLNAFLNFNYDKRFQVRFGRFKTPYTYEFYKINVWDLNAPERSLYNVNFALNRQLGGTLSGELFNDRMEYVVGAFNGQRNSYQPFKNTPDVVALLNFVPFQQVEQESWLSVFRNLNFGGSGAFGVENNPLVPAVLRTSANASAATIDSSSAYNSANVPFLAFNDNVRERGARALWEMHLAYFYQGLTLLGAWDSGFESWAMGISGPRPVRVPVNGYFVQAAYIVTGETRTETGLIDPIHPFDIRPGRFGIGAIEPTARFSEVTVGRQIFTSGFADPNLWSNRADMVDVGVNWYLNRSVKIYCGWEYSIFGQPVYYSPDHFSKTNGTFWLRFQVYH
jgi:phosphate-selective porin OprO and OprP